MTPGDKRSTVNAGGSFLLERHDPASMLTPERFDDELRMIGQSAAEFVEREIKPVFDELEALDYDLSVSLMRRAGELGLAAIEVPERYGGLGGSKAAAILVCEKLAGAGSFNVTFNAHASIGTLPIVYFGTPEQCQRYLPKLAAGELIGAYCLTEPGSGSDARGAKARASLNGAGTHYELSGTKMWISNAGFADLFTVFAQVGGDKLTTFLVERATPGLSFGGEEAKMGIKGSSTRQVIFDGTPVPVANVLGEVGKGHVIAFQALNLGRLKLAAGAVGGCKEMIRLATTYALEREQFGRKIADFGLIQEKIGRMAAATFALESAVYRLTGDLDARLTGRQAQQEQLEAIGEYVVEYSLLKVAGSELLDEVIDETLQVHGGNGFSAEYPVERAYRDSRVNRIFEGTNEINRLLITGQLLRRAVSGRLDLFKPAPAAAGAGEAASSGIPPALHDVAFGVEGLKRATTRVAVSAAATYRQDVEHEQEIMARVADMVSAVYLSESALLRAVTLEGSPKQSDAALLARLYTFEAAARLRAAAAEAVARISRKTEGEVTGLDAALPEHGADLIGLRREAALTAYAGRRYPFS